MGALEKGLVVVTGASSGIGAETARAFSRAGHPLLLLARRAEKVRELGLPRTMIAKADVTDLAALEEAVSSAEKELGPVDCLVNNAGVMLLGRADTQDPKEWKQMFDVNVMGLLNGIHVVLPRMKARGQGTIVNLSSVAGKKTFADHAVYCGTKFAVHAMTENLREEVAGSGVRFVVIAPGAVETELLSHTTSKEIKSGYEDWKQTMGGAIRPEDVAGAILFAYQQPQNVCIREIVLAATRQGP